MSPTIAEVEALRYQPGLGAAGPIVRALADFWLSAQRAPEVPREPTPEMSKRGMAALRADWNSNIAADHVWRAMYDAAGSTPATPPLRPGYAPPDRVPNPGVATSGPSQEGAGGPAGTTMSAEDAELNLPPQYGRYSVSEFLRMHARHLRQNSRKDDGLHGGGVDERDEIAANVCDKAAARIEALSAEVADLRYVMELAKKQHEADEARAEAAERALRELVDCKDLHDRFEKSMLCDGVDFSDATIALRDEYLARKPIAWANARAALASSPAEKPDA